MEYEGGVASNGMTFILSFMKISHLIQKLLDALKVIKLLHAYPIFHLQRLYKTEWCVNDYK